MSSGACCPVASATGLVLAHWPEAQSWPALHALHAAPPVPQAPSSAPVRHDDPLQQPEHKVGSHVQTPAEQRCPALHDPSWHVPPQPSSAPHALPAQLGVQHELPSHLHTPDEQRCPLGQLPDVQTPMQPSLAPQALDVQSAWQAPAPHTFAVPPPPHTRPAAQSPQATSVPHESSTSPHLPTHGWASA
jgi:hypothetical protein